MIHRSPEEVERLSQNAACIAPHLLYPEWKDIPGAFEVNLIAEQAEARGEQPDSAALPTSDGALRGDVPLSGTEGTEV